MKKIIFYSALMGCILLSVQGTAGNVNPSEAKCAATSVLIRQALIETFEVNGEFELLKDENGNTLSYIFSFEPKGFVVVNAETELPPVLFYTFEGDFEDTEYGKQLKDFLLNDIKTRLNQLPVLPSQVIKSRESEWERIIQGNFSDTGFEQWPPEGTTPTGGWLMENWHQSPPYNDFCPMDPVTGNRSVAGCPATAMAMVVNHFEELNETIFSDEDDYYHSYAGRNYWIDDDYHEQDFLNFPDMNAYLDTMLMAWANGSLLKDAEKAALTFACGVAAKQVYTSSVSGTFGVNQAFDAYQRFGFTQCELLYDTDTSLFPKLSQNMKDGEPAHLAVVDPAMTMGHNVVVDGYNTDDFYHINFGWGGTYNGWYLIPDEIPYGLTVIEGVVLNIFDIPTGFTLSKNRIEDKLLIYPNPASSFVSIENEEILQGNIVLTIYNIQGRVVETKKINRSTNALNPILINLNNKYMPGVYYCTLQCGICWKSGSFVVNK
ncbi:MAG: thiol protease/hemagglutinin PrtT [Bacteroidales bacterium]|nr:thiol protease/hemagglutinin PrtT [Bacteroidales bacterium]